MMRSMWSGVSAMKANQTKMDVVGNNIANVGTTAFKKSDARFSDSLYQTIKTATGPSNQFGGINASQVGLGVKVSSINKTMTQGSLQATGKSTDLALDGDGFFVVAKGEGPDFEYNYTRDGSFSLDREGNLVTSDGYKVLGYDYDEDGNAIEDEFINIKVPKTYISEKIDKNGDPVLDNMGMPIEEEYNVIGFEISVNGNGVLTICLENGVKKDISQLTLANFKNPEGLEQVGGNRYTDTTNSGAPIWMSGTGNPDDNTKSFGWINQGAIEMSNVDLSEEFTNMIITNRSFQAAGKMITTSDELLQEIINLKR